MTQFSKFLPRWFSDLPKISTTFTSVVSVVAMIRSWLWYDGINEWNFMFSLQGVNRRKIDLRLHSRNNVPLVRLNFLRGVEIWLAVPWFGTDPLWRSATLNSRYYFESPNTKTKKIRRKPYRLLNRKILPPCTLIIRKLKRRNVLCFLRRPMEPFECIDGKKIKPRSSSYVIWNIIWNFLITNNLLNPWTLVKWTCLLLNLPPA